MQCIHQISTAFNFKQLCEQSDANLRQYLGKPLIPKTVLKVVDTTPVNDLYNTQLFLDNFGLEESSDNSDDDDLINKPDFGLLEMTNAEDEKFIAQRQLMKASKSQKSKSSKRKLLVKAQNANCCKYTLHYCL